jgi:hypothetical protein
MTNAATPTLPFRRTLLCFALGACTAPPATAPFATGPLARRYHGEQSFAYAMRAVNEDRHQTLRYSAVAAVHVRPDAGACVEEVDWGQLVVNGSAHPLPANGPAVHQELSLAPEYRWSMPDVAHLDPALIGPVLDLMTFYVDLWLAMKTGQLVRAGDRFVVPRGGPNSWADGRRVLLGEDAIDFDVALSAVDAAARTATVIVRHVPPAQPAIRLPAAWMRAPVADTPDNGVPCNWVEVERLAADRFVSAVGRETFTVELRVDLDDGRLLSATMDNVVDLVERPCTHEALDDPGAPVRSRIHRRIELELQPAAGEAQQ